ncbi:hypothetical protein AXG93_3582s1010 [Marchantia polymorpha subsp. ruderalis]|uniref:Uncharacterized protein n=1 Tax=Marchantia polymorpha subsp. ruderalis TaxID=1480154 RepID=A0A176W0T6_MARPO|nr:hypothetical protein AXG93_3582s1010 [Marchantia polymorpha subsp. ruderalis]
MLLEVGKSSSVRPTPPSDTGGRTEILTSSVVDADVPSSVMMQMATSVLKSPLFSTTELMDLGIDLTRIFWVAATSCERGRGTSTCVEICKDTVEEPSSTSTLIEETSWHAATARMESLRAQLAIDFYKDVEDIVSFAAAVSSPLDVPLWSSCKTLQQEVDKLVKKAWSEASLQEEVERIQVIG